MSSSSVMAGVDARTQLVGRNRLELLLFRLGGKQRFGINVFKVREVIKCPSLTRAPHAHHAISGITNMRGQTITIMDLALAIGKPEVSDLSESSVIVTEYNRHIQGFLVSDVDRIVNLNWEEIKAPPSGIGNQNFLTAITNVGSELVEIIDVEKVMANIMGFRSEVSEEITESRTEDEFAGSHVLVVDDSAMARKQIIRVLDQMNIEYSTAKNGKEAWDLLRGWADDKSTPISDKCSLVLSDVEMPEMDGYTLTKNIKSDAILKELHVLLHSSLSGTFNQNMVKKVGANDFLAKYNCDELAKRVLEHLAEHRRERELAA